MRFSAPLKRGGAVRGRGKRKNRINDLTFCVVGLGDFMIRKSKRMLNTFPVKSIRFSFLGNQFMTQPFLFPFVSFHSVTVPP